MNRISWDFSTLSASGFIADRKEWEEFCEVMNDTAQEFLKSVECAHKYIERPLVYNCVDCGVSVYP